jgi:hypothetical protein
MKEEKSSPFGQVWDGFLKALGGAMATGFLWGLWKLLAWIKIIPGVATRLVVRLIPTETEAHTASRFLWRLGGGLIAFSFFYVFWRENKYVSHMYRKRDALEAGKFDARRIPIYPLTLAGIVCGTDSG